MSSLSSVPETRPTAITLAVTQINMDTISSLMGRAVSVLPSPEKDACIELNKMIGILQWRLKHNQDLLKKMSGKTEQQRDAEALVIKAAVADLQVNAPQLFIPLDEKPLSVTEIQNLCETVIQEIGANLV
jgi:hypothetical protein